MIQEKFVRKGSIRLVENTKKCSLAIIGLSFNAFPSMKYHNVINYCGY